MADKWSTTLQVPETPNLDPLDPVIQLGLLRYCRYQQKQMSNELWQTTYSQPWGLRDHTNRPLGPPRPAASKGIRLFITI